MYHWIVAYTGFAGTKAIAPLIFHHEGGFTTEQEAISSLAQALAHKIALDNCLTLDDFLSNDYFNNHLSTLHELDNCGWDTDFSQLPNDVHSDLKRWTVQDFPLGVDSSEIIMLSENADEILEDNLKLYAKARGLSPNDKQTAFEESFGSIARNDIAWDAFNAGIEWAKSKHVD